MKRSEILFGLIRIPLDVLAALTALILAYKLREGNIDLLPNVQFITQPGNLPTMEYYLSHFVVPWTLVYIVVLMNLRLYALRVTFGPWREMGYVILGALIWSTLIMAWFFLVQKQLFFSRILLIQSTVLLSLFSMTGRTLMILIQRILLTKGIGKRTVISWGKLPLLPVIRESIEEDERYTYIGHSVSVTELMNLHATTPIDLVLHTDPSPQSEATAELIDCCRSHHIGYAFLPPVFANVPHQLSYGSIGMVPMLRFEPTPLDGWGRVIKRIVDILVGGTLLILFTPLLVIVSVVILATCGLPIFYISKRVGHYGKKMIPVIKFRTMCRNADEMKPSLSHLSHRTDGPLFKITNDPRITKIGIILRRLSIDELPQLINVLLGHLSLVGPRPHLPEEVAKYSSRHRRVFTVRPGITGLAQISGRSNLTFEEEVRLDMGYIEEWSIGLDLWILWRTVFVVIFGKDAE